MNTKELIDCYIADVRTRLPRGMRDDVSAELRSLIDEELQGLAESEGKTVDLVMTKAFLQQFGHPSEVALRYRQPVTKNIWCQVSHLEEHLVSGLTFKHA